MPEPPSSPWPTDLLVTIERHDGAVRVALTGEFDLSSHERFGAAIDSVFEGAGAPIVIDLRGLSLLDAQGLRLMLRARERARAHGRELRIVAPPGPARRLFVLLGYEEELD